MNNDISSKLNSYVSAKNITSSSCAGQDNNEKTASKSNVEKISLNSMNFLGTLGHAKVNMDNPSTRHAVESFMNDPLKAELHTEFCDNLVQRGYNLEDAILKTDSVFETLKNKNIYY